MIFDVIFNNPLTFLHAEFMPWKEISSFNKGGLKINLENYNTLIPRARASWQLRHAIYFL